MTAKFTVNNAFRVVRGQLLRLKTPNIGKLPLINGKCIIKNKGCIKIGNRISIISTPYPVCIEVFKNAELLFGDNVLINYGVNIGCSSLIKIGNNVLIGSFVDIMDRDFHDVDQTTYDKSKAVEIGDNVWISNRCVICKGVKIGPNSVVAAGSVVIHDVPENVLVAGVPAEIKRELNISYGWVRQNNNGKSGK